MNFRQGALFRSLIVHATTVKLKHPDGILFGRSPTSFFLLPLPLPLLWRVQLIHGPNQQVINARAALLKWGASAADFAQMDKPVQLCSACYEVCRTLERERVEVRYAIATPILPFPIRVRRRLRPALNT